MTTSRLAILLAALLGGLSCIFLLPKQLGFQPVGVRLKLPEILGEWWGHEMPITKQEHEVLGPETEFARMDYENARGDHVLVSIVLAGQDMMTSIHRPERCLKAQGWEFKPGGERIVKVPNRGLVPVTRIHNHRIVKGDLVENLCNYWFVGNADLTASHMERVWMDSRDRLLAGYVQRWAMVMISADITKGRVRYGRDEVQTDQLLDGFIQQLAPHIFKDTVKYH